MRRTSGSSGGFTLPEVMVSVTVLLLLFGALFFICQQSTSAMLKGTTQSGLLADFQAASRRLQAAVQGAPGGSFSLAADGRGASWLSAEDEQGRFCYDPAISQARWQRYLVYYHQADRRELRLAGIPVVGTQEELLPGPIEAHGSEVPLEGYFVGGQAVLLNVDSLVFSEPEAGSVALAVQLSRKRALAEEPERLSSSIRVAFRN